MNRETEIQIIERALAHAQAQTTDTQPVDETWPASDYLDEARFLLERERLFQRRPVLLAFSAQLREAGDYLSHDATAVPIVAVRAATGQVNAFLNVCRHRGTRLVDDACGRGRRAFVCP